VQHGDLTDRSLRARGRRWLKARAYSALDWPRGALLRREDRGFEQSMNISTGGTLQTEDATIVEGNAVDGVYYAPEATRLVRWWMGVVPAQVDQYTFIDLGSGKGRVLFLAAQRGFRRVIGVEFAVELHRAAEGNVARSTLPEKDRIELVLGDAARFEFPLEPLVVHFNNPFNETVMTEVIDRLTDSYQRRPRPIVITYEQHRHESERTKSRNVELLAAVPFLTHRPLDKDSLLDRRWILQPFLVDMFESPQVRRAVTARSHGAVRTAT
jgi:SAM-dependent methyltransferase